MQNFLSSYAGTIDQVFFILTLEVVQRDKNHNFYGGFTNCFLNGLRSIDIFSFADQDKIRNGIGYFLSLKRDDKSNVSFRDNGVAAAKDVMSDISWFVKIFTPNFDNQQLVADQMLVRISTREVL